MKTILKIILSTVFLLLLSGSCEKIIPQRYSIRVKNRSSRTIYFYAEYILPDTTLPVNKPDWLRKVEQGKNQEFFDYEVGDPKFNRLDSERITIFILDEKVVDLYEWKYIRENNLILKRHEKNTQEFHKENGLNVYYP